MLRLLCLQVSIFLALLDCYCEAWLIPQSLLIYRKSSNKRSTTQLLESKTENRRGRRTSTIPYVETYTEQQLRLLFDSPMAFSTVSAIVNQVVVGGISNGNDNDDALVRRRSNTELNAAVPDSGYEMLFDPLYDYCDRNSLGSLARQSIRQQQKTISPIDNLSPREKRLHFYIQVAYNGEDFCGWQRQPNSDEATPSVQQTLEEWIQAYPMVRDTGEGVNLRVCGRTDAGVHAIGQVCRFRTRLPIDDSDLQKHLQSYTDNKSLRVVLVRRVSLEFHPSTNCNHRAYTYILNCNEHLKREQILLIDTMLRQLEAKELNYFGLSYGRLNSKRSAAKCTLFHARAHYVEDDRQDTSAIIELVGNRFLRRMVRILVATSVALAIQKGQPPSSDALLELIVQQDRTLASKPAPSDGLVFVGAVFDEI